MTNETLPLAYDEVMQQTYNQPQPIFHKIMKLVKKILLYAVVTIFR